ncbi:hypothetical protein B0H19DRAFT_1180834 [Mycena capillaripes]|nr:hypothetical protein B0H19DRAFT_1180834 [Mycena capillaripes]
MEFPLTETLAFPSPRVPPELERPIFEFAALSCPSGIPNLMLVAWRVHHWVEPMLYRVVIVSPGSTMGQMQSFPVVPVNILLKAAAARPASFLESAVRYILLRETTEPLRPTVVNGILAACPRVTSLWHSGGIPRLNALADLQCLRHLAIEVRPLFTPTEVDFTHSLFRNITHLELFDDSASLSNKAIDGLALMPHLTHIAFHLFREPNSARLHAVLQINAELHCIVFLSARWMHEDPIHPYSDDERFVCMIRPDPFVDWLRGVDGGEDHWARAEAFIAARRAGTVDIEALRLPINHLESSMSPEPRDWMMLLLDQCTLLTPKQTHS